MAFGWSGCRWGVQYYIIVDMNENVEVFRRCLAVFSVYISIVYLGNALYVTLSSQEIGTFSNKGSETQTKGTLRTFQS